LLLGYSPGIGHRQAQARTLLRPARSKQLVQSGSVQAHDHLAVNGDDGHSALSGEAQHLGGSLGVGGYVMLGEWQPLLGEVLLYLVTVAAGWRCVDDNLAHRFKVLQSP
jgi:hypothetical protein